MKFSKVIWVTIAVSLLSACQSQSVMDRRIAAHQETWRGLSAQDQHRLRQGYVFAGDTEEMVSIALGRPDKILPITGSEDQKQTVSRYEFLDDLSGSNPYDPSSSPHWASREQRVVFQNGAVVDQVGFAAVSAESSARFRSRLPDNMTKRLDSLVALAPEQKVKARAIFEQANENFLALTPNERPLHGRPIREEMRADIRAILTTDQLAKYDAEPQFLGGESAKRQ